MTRDSEEQKDEATVQALRELLLKSEPQRLGRRARFEAAIRREYQAQHRLTSFATLVLSMVVFTVLALLDLSARSIGIYAVLTAVAALFYAWGLRRIMARAEGDDRG